MVLYASVGPVRLQRAHDDKVMSSRLESAPLPNVSSSSRSNTLQLALRNWHCFSQHIISARAVDHIRKPAFCCVTAAVKAWISIPVRLAVLLFLFPAGKACRTLTPLELAPPDRQSMQNSSEAFFFKFCYLQRLQAENKIAAGKMQPQMCGYVTANAPAMHDWCAPLFELHF